MAEALAVKYRPKDWSDVCGQESVIKILERQLELGKFSHTYLFSGNSGSGKTTIGRILANKINNFIGEPIEIDGASNNGVDNVKSIISSANERSIEGKYKIFIVDECFAAGTKIKTPKGDVSIENIKAGDIVSTLEGNKKVIETHKVKSTIDNMLTVNLTNGETIHLTKDHYILTTNGWIPAQDLMKGDILLDYQTVSNMWQDIPYKMQNMFDNMWENIELAASSRVSSSETIYSQLRCLWEQLGGHSCKVNADMFQGMLFNIAVNKTERTLCFRSWDGAQEIIVRTSKNNCEVCNSHSRADSTTVRTHEDKQSYVSRGDHSEDVGHQRIQWNLASVEGTTWGEWTLYSGADAFIRELGQFLGARVSCENSYEKNERESLPYIIQSRPCLSYEAVSSRGGWQRASVEKLACKRREENSMFEQVRVDSVEVYKRGNFNECPEGDTKDLFVYDLTVEDSPTYFANGVLVHNCHMLTTQAWNAFLKCIEEPPEFTIFIFCTTDPQKIPNTILNRVQRFNINKIKTSQIKTRLEYICEQEGFINYTDACDYLSRISNGGMRDAISMLEKCAAYDNNLALENVLAALGNYSYDSFFKLTNNIIDGNEKEVLSIIEEFYENGNDLKIFVDQFLKFILDIEKYCLFKNINSTSLPNNLESDIIKCINFNDADKYYSYLLDRILSLKNSLKNNSDVRSLVEIGMLQMTRCQ